VFILTAIATLNVPRLRQLWRFPRST